MTIWPSALLAATWSHHHFTITLSSVLNFNFLDEIESKQRNKMSHVLVLRQRENKLKLYILFISRLWHELTL